MFTLSIILFVVGMVIGLAAGLMGVKSLSSLDDEMPRLSSNEDLISAMREARRRAYLPMSMALVGGALAVTGIVLAILSAIAA